MTVETTIPTAEKPAKKPKAVTQPPATAIINVPPEPEPEQFLVLTPEAVERFEKYRELTIPDFHDKKLVADVNSKRMELVRCRTTIDKTRKEMNEDARKQIAENDAKAKQVLALLAPIEAHLKGIVDDAETALEAERVAAATAKLTARKAALAAIVGEFTDMLAMYPDEFLGGMPESAFKPLLESLEVQVSVRKAAAETQRLANAAKEKEALDKLEEFRQAEDERMRLQAVEDERRKAEQAKLDEERAEFAKQQAEAKAKADAEQAEFERTKAAIAAQLQQQTEARERQEAERRAAEQAILDAERAELNRQRAELAAQQAERDAIQRMKEQGERDAVMQAAREADERVRLRLIEEMKPDLEKIHAWITSVEEHAADAFPKVSAACEERLTNLNGYLSDCISAMREDLT